MAKGDLTRGSWGVKAMESDTGLDYLLCIQNELLLREEYEYFHVKAVVYLLKYKAIAKQEA